jgi:hypothetical protein
MWCSYWNDNCRCATRKKYITCGSEQINKSKEILYLKNAVFWDVAQYRYFVNRRLGGTCHLHLQGRQIRERASLLVGFYILNMEAISSSETSVHKWSTRCHISEDGILRSHRCHSLKSYNFISFTSCFVWRRNQNFYMWHVPSRCNPTNTTAWFHLTTGLSPLCNH